MSRKPAAAVTPSGSTVARGEARPAYQRAFDAQHAVFVAAASG